MTDNNADKAKIAYTITVVDAPKVSLSDGDKAGELLLHFYRALGWNGQDVLDPRKICTTKEVYDRLYDQMHEAHPNSAAVGMLIVNYGPSVDDHIEADKVYLYEGWTQPESKLEEE